MFMKKTGYFILILACCFCIACERTSDLLMTMMDDTDEMVDMDDMDKPDRPTILSLRDRSSPVRPEQNPLSAEEAFAKASEITNEAYQYLSNTPESPQRARIFHGRLGMTGRLRAHIIRIVRSHFALEATLDII